MARTLPPTPTTPCGRSTSEYERVRDDFFAWPAHPDEADARAVREEIELVDIAVHGYGSAVFYARDRVARLRDRPVTDAGRAAVDEPATAFARREEELVPGVDEVLTDLGTRHELRLMTEGDPADSVHVVARKGRGHLPRAGRRAGARSVDDVDDRQLADILPARAAGLNAVFVPHPHTWEHEEADVDDPDVRTVGSLRPPETLLMTEHF